jgi:hypothetical protein
LKVELLLDVSHLSLILLNFHSELLHLRVSLDDLSL